MKRIVAIIGILTFSGEIIYWVAVFTGIFEVIDIIPGHRNWFMSFPMADLWLAICSLLSSIFLLKNSFRSIVFGLLAGSSFYFSWS